MLQTSKISLMQMEAKEHSQLEQIVPDTQEGQDRNQGGVLQSEGLEAQVAIEQSKNSKVAKPQYFRLDPNTRATHR